MTTNQTIDGVSRELLADLASYGESGKVPEPWMVERLRALLDAPECKACNGTRLVSDGALHCSSGGIPFENGPIDCVKNCPACAPAAQPHGKPMYQVCNGLDGWIDVDLLRYTACCLDPEEYECRVLYAGQPAPVAVVLPERKDRDGFGEFSPHSNGWNACLDEVTRLNTK